MSESSHSLGKGIWVQRSICCPAAAQREALLGTWNSQQLLPLCNSKCSAASPWLLAAEKRKERKNVAGYSIAWQPYGLRLNLLTHLKNNESLLQNKLFQTDAPAHPEPRTEGVLKHVSAGLLASRDCVLSRWGQMKCSRLQTPFLPVPMCPLSQ